MREDAALEVESVRSWSETDPPDECALLEGLERFARMLDELHDLPETTPERWEGNLSGLACRPLGRVLHAWRQLSVDEGPPADLIVRIARRLHKIVDELSRSPRKILERRRVMTPVDRMRELDVSCVQWLSKQPGKTLLEKTGPKRSLLAVQRFETLDTLENRVFVSVLQQSARQAKHYLRLYLSQFPDHDYVIHVKSFLRLCSHVLAQPGFREVGVLPSIPKPNYALLHEPRYFHIWWAYQQLVRQRLRRRQLWTERVAAWSEMCQFAVMASLTESSISGWDLRIPYALQHDVWIEERTTGGCRLNSVPWTPNWSGDLARPLVIGNGQQLQSFVPHLIHSRFEALVTVVFNAPEDDRMIGIVLQPDLSLNALRTAEELGTEGRIPVQVQRIHGSSQVSVRIDSEEILVPTDLTMAAGVFETHLARWLA